MLMSPIYHKSPEPPDNVKTIIKVLGLEPGDGHRVNKLRSKEDRWHITLPIFFNLSKQQLLMVIEYSGDIEVQPFESYKLAIEVNGL